MKKLWISPNLAPIVQRAVSGVLAMVGVLVLSCSGNGSPPTGNGADAGIPDLVDGGLSGELSTDGVSDALDTSSEVGEGVREDVPLSVEGFELFSLASGSDLHGVWGVDDVVFAVGDKGTILRRQSSHWSPMLAPTVKDLHCVFGFSHADVYAAGEDGMLLHFDGKEWVKEETGLESLSGITLRGMWGLEAHLYVVGDKGTVLHKFDSKWSKENSFSSYDLYGIWGGSLLDIWVSAQGGTVLRKIGGGWSSQQVAKGDTQLFAIQGVSTSHVWAVGSKGTIVMRKESDWTPVVSNDAYDRSLRSIVAFSEDDVWFVGDQGALIHSEQTEKNEIKWLTSDIAGPYYKSYSFMGVWGRSDKVEAWAVGEKAAVLHYDGTAWRDEPSGPVVDLNDITGNGWSEVLVVGGDGLLLAFDGARWRGLNQVTTADLRSVTRFEDRFLAVGADGVVVSVGDELQAGWTGVNTTLNGICAGLEGLVAVGDKGKILTSVDGKQWTPIVTPWQDVLNDCVADESGAVFVVGDKGRILKILGDKVESQPFVTQFNLTRVAADPAGNIWVVGNNGLILKRPANGEFKKVHEEPGLFLQGLHVFDGLVVAVGWGGSIMQLDPKTGNVEKIKLPGAGVLQQVWGADSQHIFAVGRKGKMVRYVVE